MSKDLVRKQAGKLQAASGFLDKAGSEQEAVQLGGWREAVMVYSISVRNHFHPSNPIDRKLTRIISNNYPLYKGAGGSPDHLIR
jgi:hypothetical protein